MYIIGKLGKLTKYKRRGYKGKKGVSEVFRKNKKGVLSSQMITSHDNTRG